MERDATEHQGGRDQDSRRVGNVGANDLEGVDEEEFASVEDTGAEPSENPTVDDV